MSVTAPPHMDIGVEHLLESGQILVGDPSKGGTTSGGVPCSSAHCAERLCGILRGVAQTRPAVLDLFTHVRAMAFFQVRWVDDRVVARVPKV